MTSVAKEPTSPLNKSGSVVVYKCSDTLQNLSNCNYLIVSLKDYNE